MANYLGPFSGAKDSPEGQELAGWAVGGQEILQDVKFNWGNNSAFVQCMGIVNHLKPFLPASSLASDIRISFDV